MTPKQRFETAIYRYLKKNLKMKVSVSHYTDEEMYEHTEVSYSLTLTNPTTGKDTVIHKGKQ